MGQTISIAPEIWARVRHLAFDTQSTASRLTEMALVEYLDRVEGDRRAGLATEAPAAGIKRFDGVQLHDVSVTSEKMPWDPPVVRPSEPDVSIAPPADVTPVSAAAVIVGVDEAGRGGEPVSVVIEDGQYKMSPSALAARAARLAEAKGVEFHPVPKPTSKPKTTRTRR